jgi:hypothetical protein
MDDRLARFQAWSTPPHRSIVELMTDGVLDAELAALAWILIEARLPVIVGALQRGVGKSTLLDALLDFLPGGVRRIDLAGIEEDFGWLPEAERLGWRPHGGPSPRSRALSGVSPANSYLVAAELSTHLPVYTWGPAARTLVRAASIGYGIGATIHADRLEDVHDQLRAAPVGLTDDELTYLGLILIVRARRDAADGTVRRVVAAHYARPVGRDEHGHVQRLPPAVVAARDESTDELEHFEWGVMAELGIRLGRTSGDIEADQAERAALLTGLLTSGTTDPGAVRAAIAPRSGAARRVH